MPPDRVGPGADAARDWIDRLTAKAPTFTLSTVPGMGHYKNPRDLENFLEFKRLAGLPESPLSVDGRALSWPVDAAGRQGDGLTSGRYSPCR
ncbi:MAG: hypothetical protein QF491_20540 [Alphaproteobacteria bacterium]|jgi:hypothetical protein|nr:hypothetical protein [Alphaproteobacteria bacterium]|tara:strand:- start:244 stop:519 length:276 start_codon:yes stop_codon:yes gene_type:complete